MNIELRGGAHLSGDQLIDLARGFLDRERQAAALTHLRSCPSCESRFRDVGREAELLDLGPARAASVARGPWRRRAPWIASAAAAVVAGMLLFRFAGPTPTDGLDYRLPVRSEPLILRSLPGRADTASLLAAVEAYGHDDFRRVVTLLDEKDLRGELDFLNLFYASALVWSGRNGDAERVLDHLNIDTLPQPYRDRARRVLYSALRRDGKSADAGRIVRQLADEDGEFAGWARNELTRVPAPPSK